MRDYLLSQGNIYLPIGLVLWLFALDKEGVVAIPLFIMGCLAVIFGLYSMSKAWDYIKNRDVEKRKEQRKLEKKQIEMYKELISEIRGLREDARSKNSTKL